MAPSGPSRRRKRSESTRAQAQAQTGAGWWNTGTHGPVVGAPKCRGCRRNAMIARSRRCPVRRSFAGTSGDRDELRGRFHGDALRTPMIVPAPNGARCLEVPADAPLWQEFRSAVSTERLNRPSANRKRPRSISRGFQSIRGAIRGSVGAAESSTRHRHACGPVGGQPARAPLVRELPWLGHVLDAADLSAPRRMRVAV